MHTPDKENPPQPEVATEGKCTTLSKAAQKHGGIAGKAVAADISEGTRSHAGEVR